MIVFQPAERQGGRFLIGLGGGTGSGKTLSALLLATGLVGRNGKIAVVDTEDGRALEYAPTPGSAPDFKGTFSFAATMLNEPFTPARYEEYITAAAAYVGDEGAVIIDSMSHEHEGPGGLLEMADNIARAMSAKSGKSQDVYSVPSWREPKAQHWKMVNNIKRLKCHIIFCFRAKEKLKMVTGKAPINRGIRPISEEGLPYEMSFFATMDAENPGVPHFNVKALMLSLQKFFRPGEQISEALGRRLREHSDVIVIDKEQALSAAKKVFAEGGMDGLKAHTEKLNQKELDYLRSVWKEVVTKDVDGQQEANVE